ncbi:unnamed protein product [Zymoseptoria tritici ST99CH_1A5]|uniref:Uncharacterized protein n=3 Tax=Zymoseptoria tritici TaxID=1047171 RepID=A0A1X7RE98_ZYMT9|nr:unnamed protein product [Zymoseptoria tritici ST99CH_3D7]SMR41897.1 unnamed protein product [Zymoseptoria tritici ST99CH_1E4]SMR44084.1 unnamed protein product [Zymoseptoria tritici ST99CH_3D1]SMY19240.1 unnamed protein product [Zymoseptoria tritici ST99CH_1A5]
MRRQTPIAHLLYSYLFPNPTPNDPPSFSAHLARNLVPEVRIEVATFYGDLNSAEARYPGLNYCYAPHRMRLGRFKHHKRLFDAFDNLGLTYGEIQDFCCWEGTKWARERYEKDEGVKVVDTTGDEIGPFVDRWDQREDIRRQSITRKTDISIVVEHQPRIEEGAESANEDDSDREMDGVDAGSDQPEEAAAREHIAQLVERRDHAIAQTINQRIITAWEQGQSLPPELEQYLKEQADRGDTDLASLFSQRRSSQRYSTTESAAVTSPSPQAAA